VQTGELGGHGYCDEAMSFVVTTIFEDAGDDLEAKGMVVLIYWILVETLRF
jgi:hypothetical protein